ncbi:Anti-sigma-B factor antagonist [Nocardioides dokdonensis FR1436]|uniref:Anti-sigma-B factor antagonist n=1 Tax=Nocardioides dokdonensis FR1436 TaxID=1300347 RepID=A0A1A9GL95_9ACTN|nr:STAS domain-containing protein [Nocardioides dokdonensis]ANH38373.1 Anti-sigma-B factor antagonist [Nocardioides dokdonensis FR1436]
MGTDTLATATTATPDGCRFSVVGELDLASVRALRARWSEALVGAPRRLDLDLAGLTFLDATGLGTILWCRQRALAVGLGCRVVAASPSAVRIMRLTGTHVLLVEDPPARLSRPAGAAAPGSDG